MSRKTFIPIILVLTAILACLSPAWGKTSFIDDFETVWTQSNFGPWNNKYCPDGCQVSTTTVISKNGSHCLISWDNTDASSEVGIEQNPMTLPGTTTYVRFYIYFKEPYQLGVGEWEHYLVMYESGWGDHIRIMGEGVDATSGKFFLRFQTATPAVNVITYGSTFTTGKWYCIELRVGAMLATNTTIKWWVNGEAQPDCNVGNGTGYGGISIFELGTFWGSATWKNTIYYDSVKLSDSYNGLCVPAAITNLSALTGTDPEQIKLSWFTPGDDGWSSTLPAGSKYRIQYSTWSSGIAWSTSSVQGAYVTDISTGGSVTPGTVVTAKLSGLTGGVTYYFSIWTDDEMENWSSICTPGATAWAQTGSKPRDFTITNVWLSSMTAFQAKETASNGTGYILQASSSSDYGTIAASSSTSSVNFTTLTVTGLFTNTTYYLKTGKLFGSATLWMENPVLLSTVTLTKALTNPVVYSVFKTSVTLNWQPFDLTPASMTCEGYRIDASSTNYGNLAPQTLMYTTATTNVQLSTLTVTGLEKGNTYYFRFSGLNWQNQPNYTYSGSTKTVVQVDDGNGTAVFSAGGSQVYGDNSTDEALVITAEAAYTIVTVRITIPAGLSWSSSAGDVVLSGQGFNTVPAPDVSVAGSVVTIGGVNACAITASNTGTVTFKNLTHSTGGIYNFKVETKSTSALQEITSQPGMTVRGKLVLGADSLYNPAAGESIKASSNENLIAAFTLDADGETSGLGKVYVHFTAVNGAALGTDFTYFNIYKENGSNPGWQIGQDSRLSSSDIAIPVSGETSLVPNQNGNLTEAEGAVTYYIGVTATALAVGKGISVAVNAGDVDVTGAASAAAFDNTGSFSGNQITRGSGLSQPSTANMMRMGADRHTFCDGTYYWVFYLNSSGNVVFSTSTTGVNWGAEEKVNDSASNLTSMGIWEDGTYVYAAYSNGSASYVRRINISAPHTMGAESTFTTGGHNNPQIIKDTNKYLWRKGEAR